MFHSPHRTFVAIHVGDEAKVLTSYTKAIDSALKEFKLPSYYEVSYIYLIAHVSVKEKSILFCLI